MNNVAQNSPQYSTIFLDGTWNYFAVSIYRYSVGSNKGCRMRFMTNAEALNSVISCVGYVGLTVDSTAQMSIATYRNYIFNRMRIYQQAFSVDEMPEMINTVQANCVAKLAQPACSICPLSGYCMTVCN